MYIYVYIYKLYIHVHVYIHVHTSCICTYIVHIHDVIRDVERKKDTRGNGKMKMRVASGMYMYITNMHVYTSICT